MKYVPEILFKLWVQEIDLKRYQWSSRRKIAIFLLVLKTVWKVSVFGVFLVRIQSEYKKYGPEKLAVATRYLIYLELYVSIMEMGKIA